MQEDFKKKKVKRARHAQSSYDSAESSEEANGREKKDIDVYTPKVENQTCQ